MARVATGWKLIPPTKPGRPYTVRFRHQGKRYHLSTGSTDYQEASRKAAQIYAEVISGRQSVDGNVATSLDLETLFGLWLSAVSSQYAPRTLETFETHVRAHLLDYFGGLADVTSARWMDYMRARLRVVQRKTVVLERATLLGFIAWCVEQGHLREAPVLALPGKKVLGTPDPKGRRKRVKVDLSPDEAEAIIAHLPEMSRAGGRPKAFYTVLWETGLRPATIYGLRAPDDYVPGRTTLTIRAENDKNRDAREVPLTERAREALSRMCPEVGLIFPHHSYRKIIRKAAAQAGVRAVVAENVSKYDFRHARLGSLTEGTQNLRGVAHLAGHLQVTTLNRYVKPNERAARAVLESAGELFGTHSGHGSISLDLLTPDQRRQVLEIIGVSSVGARGFEPPTPRPPAKRQKA
jgi:integrase